MKMRTVNLPLLALFGLCYGLGHPSLAAFRPAMIDKTLASFHTDLNRSVVAWSDDLAKTIFPEPQAAPAPSPVIPVAALVMAVEPVLVKPAPARGFADVARTGNAGFSALVAR